MSLFDQPIYIALIGLFAAVAAGFFWTSTGRQAWLAVLVIVIAFTVGMLVAERIVVTDREAIRQTLAEIARDVQSNDVSKVVAHLSPANRELIERARGEMPNYQFTDCHITQVHATDVDASQEPRSAVVEFNVSVTGSFRVGGAEGSGTYPRWVKLHLVRDKDGGWLVQDYEHDDPLRFVRQTEDASK